MPAGAKMSASARHNDRRTSTAAMATWWLSDTPGSRRDGARDANASASHTNIRDDARKAAVEHRYPLNSRARPLRHQRAIQVVVTGAATAASSRADMLKRLKKLATSASCDSGAKEIECMCVTRCGQSPPPPPPAPTNATAGVQDPSPHEARECPPPAGNDVYYHT